MKKITDSLLNRIVRQSLNENYGLLNEAAIICPAGGFCIGTDYEGIVNSTKNNGTYVEKLKNIGDLCNKVKMGKPTINDSLISSFADKLFELLGKGGVYTEVDENKVKGQLNQIKNFRNFCAVKKIFKEKTNFSLTNDYPGGLRSVNSYPFSQDSNSANEDTQTYVLSPLLNAINVSLSITENQKKTNNTEEKTNKEKKDADLLVAAKKCGWNSVDEYKKSGFKCDGPAYTPGGGGNSANQVSFAGYECISEHPALIKTPIKIDKGVGYKLNTGNKTIDSFVFGIQKQGDGDTAIDQGVIVRPDSGIAVNIDCTSKYLQHSLSTTVWNYDAIIDEKGKIALTTDPAREDAFTNESYKHKSFRYNLLTEAPTGTTTGNTVFELSVAKKSKGSDVKLIQQKLGLKDDGSFGLGTEAAVKTFQEKYKTQLTTSTPGIVDQATFDLIKKLKDTNAKKVYSGQKHNYVAGNWIKVTPETQDPQLTGNDGYFKITSVTDYTVVIDTDFVSPSTTGGSTQRVLFGEDAKEGTQEVIKKDRNNNDNDNKGRRNNSGTKSYNGNIDPEKQKQRKLRNQETCNTLREIKQYLNNTKGLSMTVNCKWNQEIRNQVMISLTGGTPVTPVTPVDTNTQTSGGGSVTVY